MAVSLGRGVLSNFKADPCGVLAFVKRIGFRIASGGSFPEGIGAFSSSIARPRAALLRRASVGNFEIVEESADKKTRTVRFRIEK